MLHQINDFKAIAERCDEIRRSEGGPNVLPPLAVSGGAVLDEWAKLYELTRNHGEDDQTLRDRVRERV